ncbi:hypothetical protein C2S52_020754 [Perilla frutescens var. hirtella]|nr:hypothetical protein C2S52_020754 [Perilla frutescens var. hirtella]
MPKSLSTPELLKIKFDECHNILTEEDKNMKLEMAKVVRERDTFEEELNSLQKTRTSEKAILERRCNELEKTVAEMEVKNRTLRREKLDVENKLKWSERKYEALKVDANESMEEMKRKEIEVQKLQSKNEELRVEKMELEGCKKRINYLESRMLKLKQLADLEDATNSPHQLPTRSNILTSQPKPKENPRKRMVQMNKKYAEKASVQGASHSRISLNRRCDLKIINRIKEKLDEENLERFEQSCFGHFLEIGDLKFQGQLLLQLVMHMVTVASNEERGLVFKIGNSNMEFGPNEFSEITGLNHGGSTLEATKTCSSIHEHVFGGSTSIMLKDVEKAFSSVSGGKGDLALKLALLYFLYGVLLNKTTRSSSYKINNEQLQYLDLVEDLEKFNAFPWGRVAYHCLASSIMLARHHLINRESHSIHGFCFALQIWAYEMMPDVAEHCAIPLAEKGFQNLPILRWCTVLRSVRYNELNEFFTPGDKAHLDRWIPNRHFYRIPTFGEEHSNLFTVHDLFNEDGVSWNINLIKSIYPEEIAHDILLISICDSGSQDCIMWNHTKSGTYSVRSGYWVAMSLKDASTSKASSSSYNSTDWRWFWKLSIPPRIKIFIWKCMRGVLPTNTNLAKKGIVLDHTCVRCSLSEESPEHAPRDCPWVNFFWKICVLRLQRTLTSLSLQEWILEIIHNKEEDFLNVFAVHLWIIWYSRNKLVFDQINMDYLTCLSMALSTTYEYKRGMESINNKLWKCASMQGWKPPPSVYKLNTNASIDDNGNSALACYQGIRLAKEHGLQNLVIEMDNQELVNILLSRSIPPNYIGNIIADIHHIISDFHMVLPPHVNDIVAAETVLYAS